MDGFEAAATFEGRREGYVFTTRNGFTGYFIDMHNQAQKRRKLNASAEETETQKKKN